jgi:hypothetical protein
MSVGYGFGGAPKFLAGRTGGENPVRGEPRPRLIFGGSTSCLSGCRPGAGIPAAIRTNEELISNLGWGI